MDHTTRDFKKLQVWHKAHEMVLNVYLQTKAFPRTEMFGLTSQTRRAAVSVPANLAEGCGRGGAIELARFMDIAQGSASELQYYALLARDLKMLSAETADAIERQIVEVRRMMTAYVEKLRS